MSDFRRSNRMIRNSILFATAGLTAIWGVIVRPMQTQQEHIEQNTRLTPQEEQRNTKLTRRVTLRIATEKGDWQQIQAVLAEGIPIDQDIGDCTALMTAARYGKTEILRKLLVAGAKTETREQFGNTTLHYAARYGQDEAIEILLEHGANLNAKNERKLNAIDLAIIGQHRQTYELLKAHKLKVNPLQALTFGDIKLLRKLIAEGANLNAPYQSGDPQAYRVDKSGLDRSSQVNFISYFTPLFGALQLKQWETAEFLLKNGAKVDYPDQYGGTALMLSASYRNKEAVEFLLEHGANVNYRSQNGSTALTNAVQFGEVEMVKFLLHHSARMNTKLNNGKGIFELGGFATLDKQREIERILKEAQTK